MFQDTAHAGSEWGIYSLILVSMCRAVPATTMSSGPELSPDHWDLVLRFLRLPDLAPSGFFLCGYLKFLVYNDFPRTLEALDNNIH